MNKPLLILVTLFIKGQLCFSQDSLLTGKISNFSGLELFYSKFNLNIDELNNSSITSIGLNLKTNLVLNRRYTFDWEGFYSLVIPQTFALTNNLQTTLSGYNWGMLIYGQDLLHKHERVDFIIGLGFNAGNYKIILEQNHTSNSFSNPIFSPKIQSELRFILGRVSLGLRGSYMWDISSGTWKNKNDSSFSFNNAKFTGLDLQGFIGFGRKYKH